MPFFIFSVFKRKPLRAVSRATARFFHYISFLIVDFYVKIKLIYNYKLAIWSKNKYNLSVMECSEEFKQRFLELISDLDSKKSEVPKLLNIDYNIYKKITELGIIPKPIVLIRIADYFNISIEYLLGRTDNSYFEKSDLGMTFLDRYQSLKQEKNLTDYAVAQKLHIATSYTTNWKNKRYIPSIINLIVLSEELKVTIDYLLGRTDDRTLNK